MTAVRVLLASLWLAVCASVAWACPACAAQQTTWTATLKLLGGMLILPFIVAGTVIWVVRRAVLRDSTADDLRR